jgi:hypothetical protein
MGVVAHILGPTVFEIAVAHLGPRVDLDTAEPQRRVSVGAMGDECIVSAASQIAPSSRARLAHIPLPADHEEYIKNGNFEELRKRCRTAGLLYKIPERFKTNGEWVRLYT